MNDEIYKNILDYETFKKFSDDYINLQKSIFKISKDISDTFSNVAINISSLDSLELISPETMKLIVNYYNNLEDIRNEMDKQLLDFNKKFLDSKTIIDFNK